MKNIIRKIKNWLINKLGGYTVEDVHKRCSNHVRDFTEFHTQVMDRWRKAVQEICRKSNDTYYDWCCEYCWMDCDKRNGWCKRFVPKIATKESEDDD